MRLLQRWRPDRLILQTLDRQILKWALKRGVDTEAARLLKTVGLPFNTSVVGGGDF